LQRDDATLDRTTDGTGKVCDQNWAGLARLRLAGTGEELLRLSDVTDILAGSTVMLRPEIKRDAAGAPYPYMALLDPAQIFVAGRAISGPARNGTTHFRLSSEQ
jgi:glycerophosphoryl diester phosphodiesterase